MATTGKLKGRALLIYVNGNAITHSKSADLTINGNLVDSTTKDSAGWMEYEDAGNKGANLATMTSLGLPVPPGFTLSIEAYKDYEQNKQLPFKEIEQAISSLEKSARRKLGQGLSVSVRSSAS